MKVWITKNALTQGITEKDVPESDLSIKDGELRFYEHGYLQSYSLGEWSDSRITAIENAEKMRIKKIESLQKQIEKLKKLRFK